jgi:hypothetical protein
VYDSELAAIPSSDTCDAMIAPMIVASHVVSPVQNCCDDARARRAYRQSDEVNSRIVHSTTGDDLSRACEPILKTHELTAILSGSGARSFGRRGPVVPTVSGGAEGARG